MCRHFGRSKMLSWFDMTSAIIICGLTKFIYWHRFITKCNFKQWIPLFEEFNANYYLFLILSFQLMYNSLLENKMCQISGMVHISRFYNYPKYVGKFLYLFIVKQTIHFVVIFFFTQNMTLLVFSKKKKKIHTCEKT